MDSTQNIIYDGYNEILSLNLFGQKIPNASPELISEILIKLNISDLATLCLVNKTWQIEVENIRSVKKIRCIFFELVRTFPNFMCVQSPESTLQSISELYYPDGLKQFMIPTDEQVNAICENVKKRPELLHLTEKLLKMSQEDFLSGKWGQL